MRKKFLPSTINKSIFYELFFGSSYKEEDVTNHNDEFLLDIDTKRQGRRPTVQILCLNDSKSDLEEPLRQLLDMINE